jgi:hypothetical protein
MPTMDEQSRTQLRVLGQIDAILSSLRIRFWVRGGWAIDLYLGRVTRSHADIDLVLWQRHRKRASRALSEAGFVLDNETEIQMDWTKDGQDITFIFIERRADGAIRTRGVPSHLEWLWSLAAFSRRSYTLDTISARIISPQQPLDDMEAWEAATGRSLRPKDARSLEVLRSIVESR